MRVRKRNGDIVPYEGSKITKAIHAAFAETKEPYDEELLEMFIDSIPHTLQLIGEDVVDIETIQNMVERWFMMNEYYTTAKAYILYREKHNEVRNWVDKKIAFIENYKQASNNANATVDDNSNVASKNVGIMNNESHKPDNIQISRGIITRKLKELYPDFDSKQYVRDLENHIIYKHDESAFSNPVPYCVSITMYPFLTDGLKKLGGLSASPKNLNSFCGIFVNLVHAIAGQFAGAVAASEFLLYFTYFAKKEWGEDFYIRPETVISQNTQRTLTIEKQIEQYFQQIVYTINQPVGSRGLQSVFFNISYFDKAFFEGMFGDFYFPDGTKPDWESLNWIQRKFMMWFNEERLKCVLTFPVESFALVYKDDKFVDEDSANFVAQEYARGHSFFTYISDTVDSLSSCCRLRNMLTTKEFNYTNGNMGVQTGSKSVITLNLSRIIQDWFKTTLTTNEYGETFSESFIGKAWGNTRENHIERRIDYSKLANYIKSILDRVYKYHTAYNELLWDMKNAGLLTVYDAGFIDLNKQYLTIGINGLNQAAEFLGIECNNNETYRNFCKVIFSTISEFCENHKGKYFGHQITLNVEMVPAESLAIKNYNWDKEDGYWVPDDTNLYASYVFKPNDPDISILDKMILHSNQFASQELSGGQAAHLNLNEHLTEEQYKKLLNYAGEIGCSYFTFNVPNSECDDCGFITKTPITECPKCHSKNISYYDRIIGYLTKIKNWSQGRQKEQKTRIYGDKGCLNI